MLKRFRAAPAVIPGLLLWLLCLLGGCASLPYNYPRPVSSALLLPEKTQLGQKIQPIVVQHQGNSGFHLLVTGHEAFMARLLLIANAQHTLDLQYYIFEDDVTGKYLMDRMIAAAERGVRVRLLLDDWKESGKMDWGLALAETNPNIQVRVFNPLGGLRLFLITRSLQVVLGPQRLMGRMHNKSFIADNSVAIVGGRNIGDAYFGARADINFGDMDIMSVGPVTRKISAVFDDYWNSALAFPIQALKKRQPTAEDLEKMRNFLAANRESVKNSAYARQLQESKFAQQVEAGRVPYIWGEAEVLYDNPLKVINPEERRPPALVGHRLRTLIEEARSEVLVITPYFVPRKAGLEWFKKLRDRGVTVKVLTNSLASTDSAVAEGGYARYRKPLLEMGVELYELKPNPDQWRFWDRISLGGSSSSSRGALHAKTVIIDGQVVFVGSFNLDPRSARLDTQNGVAVWSKKLAAQTSRLFARGISPSNAYRVILGGSAPETGEWHGLVWVTAENGKEVRYHQDPMTSIWRRLEMRVLSWIAPESLL